MFKKLNTMEHQLSPPPHNPSTQSFSGLKACLIALVSLALLSVPVFGQTTAASLSGTVMDASKAVLPGASITATNEDTGVASRTTANNSGVYNFPSLQPGTYRVTAELSGFQRSTLTNVRMGSGSQNNLNFDLAVAGMTTEVEVTASVESMILEAGSSTGTVLQENAVIELPMVANDVLELVSIMGGVVQVENRIFDTNQGQTFAGVAANNVNISRDGISVSEVRWSSGISPNRLNPELVGEFKMILSPVDAEMGRGAGQLQISTRSGTNAFHGSGVWTIQNTALDAVDFSIKRYPPELVTLPPWRNLHNYTLTGSGPIIQNKTFFFVSWDHQIARTRQTVRPRILTPCARKGIYRYLENVRINNVLDDPVIQTGGVHQRPSVDMNTGAPLETYTFPNDPGRFGDAAGKTFTNGLRFESVLGVLEPSVRAALADRNNPGSAYGDCSAYNFSGLPNNGIVAGTAWDNYRNHYDQSGFVTRFSALMPEINDYQTGDGLNVATHRWTRTVHGNATTFGGSSYDDIRKAITFKIDHNINAEHRVSGTYSYEKSTGIDAESGWPGFFDGQIIRKPQTFTLSLISTLSPTLLNEYRMGTSITSTMTYDPMYNPLNGDRTEKLMLELTPTDNFKYYKGLPVVAGPGDNASSQGGTSAMFHPDAGGSNSHPFGSRGNLPGTWGGDDSRWTFADTVTWMKGAHSFKGGFEFRINSSYQNTNGTALFSGGSNSYPSVKGGVLSAYSPLRDRALSSNASYWRDMPVSDYDHDASRGQTRGGNFATAYNLMTYMAGSVGSIAQYSFAFDQNRWNDAGDGELWKATELRSREVSFFFKDDWKLTSDLTLNLGFRYEYYGAPWEINGMASSVKDGVRGMFGVSGLNGLSEWMPANPTDTAPLTQQVFIGPNSPNPDIPAFYKDLNNFAPHVGFAWTLPWFGRGLTTLRGGYSINYSPVDNFDSTHGYGGALTTNVPGTTYSYTYAGSPACIAGEAGCYLSFENFSNLIPLNNPRRDAVDGVKGFIGLNAQPTVLGIQPVERRDQNLKVYDLNIRTPYIQSLNMSLTRSIGKYFTADVRYIGTLSRKLLDTICVTCDTTTHLTNLNQVNLFNNGLMEALKIARAGGESEMLNNYIKPGTLIVVGGNTNMTGSAQVRSRYGANLANGNMQAIARSLALENGDYTSVLGQVPAGVWGRVLRNGGAPETLIFTNPQYASVEFRTNRRSANYHSMQAQFTMRPAHGLNFQATYTWSRNLGIQTISDYRDWKADYRLNSQHRSHTFTSNGNYTLPFGPNGLLLRNASGVLKKAVEGWGFGWILTLSTGQPMSLAGNATLWSSGNYVDQVGPFDTKSGRKEWDSELGNGQYFGGRYARVIDPQCGLYDSIGYTDPGLVATALKAQCGGASGLKALALVDDSQPIVGYRNYSATAGLSNPVRGTLIFQNARPGERGNFGANNLTGIGRFGLDANMGKTIEFMEGKKLEIRVDAMNILNHATPAGSGGGSARIVTIGNPSMTMNSSAQTPWGYLDRKAGHRTFQARLALRF